jgi:hypothetical protein
MVEVRDSLGELYGPSSEAPESKPEFDSGDSCDRETGSSKRLRMLGEGPSVYAESGGPRRKLPTALEAAS